MSSTASTSHSQRKRASRSPPPLRSILKPPGKPSPRKSVRFACVEAARKKRALQQANKLSSGKNVNRVGAKPVKVGAKTFGSRCCSKAAVKGKADSKTAAKASAKATANKKTEPSTATKANCKAAHEDDAVTWPSRRVDVAALPRVDFAVALCAEHTVLIDLPATELDLGAVLPVGQTFRWLRVEASASDVLSGVAALPATASAVAETGLKSGPVALPTVNAGQLVECFIGPVADSHAVLVARPCADGPLLLRRLATDGVAAGDEGGRGALAHKLAAQACADFLRFVDAFPGQSPSLRGVLANVWLPALRARGAPQLARLLERGRAVRVTRQAFNECLLSFMLSQNNNVDRISKLTRVLGARFGRQLLGPPTVAKLGSAGLRASLAEVALHTSPDVGLLADEGVLRGLGCGYRAAYFAKNTASREPGWVGALGARCLAARRRADAGAVGPRQQCDPCYPPRGLAKVRAELTALTGVGPKVADCVALYSLGVDDCVPVDVHVARWLGGTSDGAAGRFAAAVGGLGGWAHSVLFSQALACPQEKGGNDEEDDIVNACGEALKNTPKV